MFRIAHHYSFSRSSRATQIAAMRDISTPGAIVTKYCLAVSSLLSNPSKVMCTDRLLAPEHLTGIAKAAGDGRDWSLSHNNLRRSVKPVALQVKLDRRPVRRVYERNGRLRASYGEVALDGEVVAGWRFSLERLEQRKSLLSQCEDLVTLQVREGLLLVHAYGFCCGTMSVKRSLVRRLGNLTLHKHDVCAINGLDMEGVARE